MTTLWNLLATSLGVFLSIRMIAALYLIIDLWYRIGADYPRVIRNILGWAATIAVVAWALDATNRAAFASGLAAFLVFYVSLFGLRHVLIAALRKRAARSGEEPLTPPWAPR